MKEGKLLIIVGLVILLATDLPDKSFGWATGIFMILIGILKTFSKKEGE